MGEAMKTRSPLRVLITGAARGIGQELVRQYAAREDDVEASVRTQESILKLQTQLTALWNVHIDVCDVGVDESVEHYAAKRVGSVDVLINNAGVKSKQDERLDDLAGAQLVDVYNVNAVGALRMARAFKTHLERASYPRVVNISSQLSSLTHANGGSYGYRMSKVALNMATRCLATEWAHTPILVAAISPGWVRTDMGGQDAPLSVEKSVASIIQLIDTLKRQHHGGLFEYDGAAVPW